MQVEMLYFGLLKDLIGCDRERLQLVEGACVDDALRLLRVRASNVQEAVWSCLAVAVNREYATGSTVLDDSDEIALMPPVSGGV